MSHENKTSQIKSFNTLPTTKNNSKQHWWKSPRLIFQFKITLYMYVYKYANAKTNLRNIFPSNLNVWIRFFLVSFFFSQWYYEIFFLLNGKTRHIYLKKSGFAWHETVFRLVCVSRATTTLHWKRHIAAEAQYCWINSEELEVWKPWTQKQIIS